MKLKSFFIFLFFTGSIIVYANHFPQIFDKESFYNVMKSEDINKIDDELNILEEYSIKERGAYEGALLMKKAGLTKKAGDKLKFFKEGRVKLETALMNDPGNGEYHFLRLTVQEHAPKIVKYNKDVEKDADFIRKIFKSLPGIVQQAIIDYSKTSKILQPEDFTFAAK